jgi:hypothetical protein
MELYPTRSRTLPPVIAEVPFDASVTLYLRAGASTVARDGQANARARAEALVEAGILLDLTVSEWPSKVVVPTDGPADPAVEVYDEFAEAVGDHPNVDLGPSFEDRSDVAGVERMVVLPVVCLAVRRGGELTGIYPCWNGGRHESVEDGLAALEAGEDVENLT